MNDEKLKGMRESVNITFFMGTFLILVGLVAYALSTDYNKDLIELSIICWVIGFWVHISGIGIIIIYLFEKKKEKPPTNPNIFLSLRLDKLENKFERVENLIDELNEKARPKIKRRKRKEIKHD